MRIFLALVFFAPLVGFAAAKVSPELLLPALVTVSVLAMGAQYASERRQRRAA